MLNRNWHHGAHSIDSRRRRIALWAAGLINVLVWLALMIWGVWLHAYGEGADALGLGAVVAALSLASWWPAMLSLREVRLIRAELLGERPQDRSGAIVITIAAANSALWLLLGWWAMVVPTPHNGPEDSIYRVVVALVAATTAWLPSWTSLRELRRLRKATSEREINAWVEGAEAGRTHRRNP